MPQFADVVRDFGAQPDPLVTTVMAISDGLRNNGKQSPGRGLVLVVFASLALAGATVRIDCSAFFSGMPGIRGVVVLRRTTHVLPRLRIRCLETESTLTDALRFLSEAHRRRSIDCESYPTIFAAAAGSSMQSLRQICSPPCGADAARRRGVGRTRCRCGAMRRLLRGEAD